MTCIQVMAPWPLRTVVTPDTVVLQSQNFFHILLKKAKKRLLKSSLLGWNCNRNPCTGKKNFMSDFYIVLLFLLMFSLPSEYTRKKRNVLRLSAVKALATLLPQKPNKATDTNANSLDAFEEDYLRKRQKRSHRYFIASLSFNKKLTHPSRKYRELAI